MGPENGMWSTGAKAEQEFSEFEQKKAVEQRERQQKFDALTEGEAVSFMDDNGKYVRDWKVKEKHLDTLTVTLHNQGASFIYDVTVPIDRIEIPPAPTA